MVMRNKVAFAAVALPCVVTRPQLLMPIGVGIALRAIGP